jgi:hypothetical protein
MMLHKDTFDAGVLAALVEQFDRVLTPHATIFLACCNLAKNKPSVYPAAERLN